MVDFLYQVPAESLEIIAFRVSLADDGIPMDPDVFGELPSLLQSSLFSHLRTVRFVQQGLLPLDAVEEVLGRTFPQLHAKGVLVVATETELAIPQGQWQV